ncbi:FixH family protein [Bacillus sp. EB106-08-02-XG196]|uniref:FixH family protein n=1 Tax=Bacillus sp. EB106-08-02-XG196 TaxID=2737049 RepID=UPI0015C4E269|nr:FixH family protein [Bacillus sp. EB106-08-02-XG196]NWQ40895.1 FixH family protein [Bacillus sp. EB106-08-02-XG196]
MKKVMRLTALLLLAVLAGCSADPEYSIEVVKPIYQLADKEMPFEIKVTEKEEAASGLNVSAEFSMTNMDHGTTEVELTEAEDGIHSGKVELPMTGKYEIFFVLEKDGKKAEKVINYEVKQSEGVASINGEWITNEDIEFYKFINYLQLAINRETDQKRYTGDQLKEALTYWDSQEKLVEDQNQLLTQIIRLRSMAMLAEEKGHTATDAEVETEITKVRDQYSQYESAKAMINEYGEDKFWEIEKQQYQLIVLSQKVQKDIIEKVKKENPKMGQQEINFQAQKQYEELLVSQVNSMKIVIL